jgi:hypothetical protein
MKPHIVLIALGFMAIMGCVSPRHPTEAEIHARIADLVRGHPSGIVRKDAQGLWHMNLSTSGRSGTSPVADGDLSVLKGIPVGVLSVSRNVSDLTPLKGMPLTSLTLHATKVVDLTPLKGMKLERLFLAQTKVKDFSVLSGMPLKELDVRQTAISDLSPLKGLPLEELKIGGTTVKDLTPLSGAPLENIQLFHTPVSDLSPLQDAPLRIVDIMETSVTDVSALANAPLEMLFLSVERVQKGMSLIRKIKTLKTIGYRYEYGTRDMPAAEFWKKYDAGQIPIGKSLNREVESSRTKE